MATVDDAVQSQARNIELATGQSIDAWVALVKVSGKERHTEILAWLKAEHGFQPRKRQPRGPDSEARLARRRGAELVDAMYAGPKATLRPFHDQVIELTRGFGDDVEPAPKQAYVSLRRSKQFGTVGPGPAGRLEVGLNLKGVEPTGRLEATGGMCTHRVRLSSPDELDAEVIRWLGRRMSEHRHRAATAVIAIRRPASRAGRCTSGSWPFACRPRSTCARPASKVARAGQKQSSFTSWASPERSGCSMS